MGNCLTSNKVMAQEEQYDEPLVEIKATEQTELPLRKKKVVRFNLGEENDDRERHGDEEANESAPASPTKSKKRVVRFELDEINGEKEGKKVDCRSGVVRIRLVMTQKELKQILEDGYYGHSSVEQLIDAMKLRSRKASEFRSTNEDCGINGSWSPDLESIPEEN